MSPHGEEMLLTGVQEGSSFCSSSLSSDWLSLYLSPQRPAYSWKVHITATIACSRGLAILTATDKSVIQSPGPGQPPCPPYP